MNRITVTIFILLLLTGGCARKENYIVLMSGTDGSTGVLSLETPDGTITLDEAGKAIVIEDADSLPAQTTDIDNELTNTDFAQALAVHPLMPQSFLLYFNFDSNQLTENSRQLLPGIKAAAEARANVDIAIIGHTDRTGDDDYNQKLSLQRAEVVFSLLKAEGIEEKAMKISYHGEGNPLIPTADNVAEPKNRRVEVVIR